MTRLVPQACGSDEEHRRYHHDDLEALDVLTARVELWQLEVALVTSHRRQHVVDADWLRSRRALLNARLRAAA